MTSSYFILCQSYWLFQMNWCDLLTIVSPDRVASLAVWQFYSHRLIQALINHDVLKYWWISYHYKTIWLHVKKMQNNFSLRQTRPISSWNLDLTVCISVSLIQLEKKNLKKHYHDNDIKWNIIRVTDPLCGEFTGHWCIPSQRPVTRSFDDFFDLRLNKRLSKQSWG